MPETLDILLRRWREGDESAQAEVVDRLYSELRIAQTLGISIATVKRDWTFARAWLLDRLRG